MKEVSLGKLRSPSKHLISTLAKNVRNLRKIKGMSQEDLADLCDIHRTYIGSVERCERNVTLSTLEVLANALDVSITQLLTPMANDTEISES